MSGSGISWAVCKSALRFRQITTPAPHHSVFLQAGCPSCRPTNNSVKTLKAKLLNGKLEKSRNAYSRLSVLTGRTVCCIAVIEHQPVVSWTAVEPPHTSAYDNWRTAMFSLREWTKRTDWVCVLANGGLQARGAQLVEDGTRTIQLHTHTADGNSHSSQRNRHNGTVCVQLCTYADNVALPTHCMPLPQQSINIHYPMCPQQQTHCCRFSVVGPCLDRHHTISIDLALYAMQTVPI